jgi:acyl carrier protein
MNEAEVYAFLGQVFKDVFGRDDINIHPGLTAKDVMGWDSLRQVQITLALEEKWGIRIRTKELNNLANIGDMVGMVVKKTSALA